MFYFGYIILLSCTVTLIGSNPSEIVRNKDENISNAFLFETSHKHPKDSFSTAHSILFNQLDHDRDSELNTISNMKKSMNILPTKERPELNPVLSALINEDVMKSIEAKRAIEQQELDIIKTEKAIKLNDFVTEVPYNILTTTSETLLRNTNNAEIVTSFSDQSINLETAGSENNKKSRIEIKKAPNGQDYEYEYVYYYEDEDDENKFPKSTSVKTEEEIHGKSRYTNIERNTNNENSLKESKSINDGDNIANDNITMERLPANTRFPSRGKNVNISPTPSLEGIENIIEKKKISVKRPSLELVDSETFNTDEKQSKGLRNADVDTKLSNKDKFEKTSDKVLMSESSKIKTNTEYTNEENASNTPEIIGEEIFTTPPTMEKAALDLYAIIANENFNMDSTTATTIETTDFFNTMDTTISDVDSQMFTEIPTTTTTVTTSDSATITATTKSTVEVKDPTSIIGLNSNTKNGKRPSRNRYRSKQNSTTLQNFSTTESSSVSESPKPIKSRFNRPYNGGRNRYPAKIKTTLDQEEADKIDREIRPDSSGSLKNSPRNRFNLRSSTTEKPPASENIVPEGDNTVTRNLRNRPPGLRSRGRIVTKAPLIQEDEQVIEENVKSIEATKLTTVKPSRFNVNRAQMNKHLPRTRTSRTTETPITSEDESGFPIETIDGSEQKIDIDKIEEHHATRHKSSRLNNIQRPIAGVTTRKINPILAKRRLQLGQSTTEAILLNNSPTSEHETEIQNLSDDTTEIVEITTKQARGLQGLLGKRRRLPIRKPGTIL